MGLSEVIVGFQVTSLGLYLVATILGAWPCGRLFRECHQVTDRVTEGMVHDYNVIGGLLIASLITTAIGLICCLIGEGRWVRTVAYIALFIAFVLALTMEIYYHVRIQHNWSSFTTTIALTLCFQVFIIQAMELHYRRYCCESDFVFELM